MESRKPMPSRTYGAVDTVDGKASWLLLADEHLAVIDFDELISVTLHSLHDLERAVHFVIRKAAGNLGVTRVVKFDVGVIGRIDPHVELISAKHERDPVLLRVEEDVFEEACGYKIERVLAFMNIKRSGHVDQLRPAPWPPVRELKIDPRPYRGH